MECLDTTKYLKINRKVSIGNVLLIVEGAEGEIELFKQIFYEILKYNYTVKPRTKDKFKDYDVFVRPDNENSRVTVINAKNSNISTLKKDRDYLNNLYMILYEDYGIDVKNIRVYYVWDRDNDSNLREDVRYFIKNLNDPWDNENGDMHGLLILSYPCLEAYILSGLKKTYSKNLKKLILKRDIRSFNHNNILRAVIKMHEKLGAFNIREYNVDKFHETSLKVFEKEEMFFEENGYYKWLSFISIILIDLGIIECKDN